MVERGVATQGAIPSLKILRHLLSEILGGGGIFGSPVRAPQEPSERWRADRLVGSLLSPKLRYRLPGPIRWRLRQALESLLQTRQAQAEEQATIGVIGNTEEGIHAQGVASPCQQQRHA